VIVLVAVVIDLLQKQPPPRQKPAGCKFDTIKKSRAYALASLVRDPLRRMRRGRATVINVLMGP
jgi:hypothetical protein